MEQLLDSVARDESNAGDLHALRKEVKKLRYLLELAPGTENEVSALADWQEVLGSIHDLDVTIEYVKQDARGARAEGLLRELQLSRRSKYLEFVKRRGGESARILRGGGMPSVRRR
jgi:CHAD domain-containing protein